MFKSNSCISYINKHTTPPPLYDQFVSKRQDRVGQAVQKIVAKIKAKKRLVHFLI